ncbi:MAG: hypothetical protein ABL983_09140, partial [Nitrospira sp.]
KLSAQAVNVRMTGTKRTSNPIRFIPDPPFRNMIDTLASRLRPAASAYTVIASAIRGKRIILRLRWRGLRGQLPILTLV